MRVVQTYPPGVPVMSRPFEFTHETCDGSLVILEPTYGSSSKSTDVQEERVAGGGVGVGTRTGAGDEGGGEAEPLAGVAGVAGVTDGVDVAVVEGIPLPVPDEETVGIAGGAGVVVEEVAVAVAGVVVAIRLVAVADVVAVLTSMLMAAAAVLAAVDEVAVIVTSSFF